MNTQMSNHGVDNESGIDQGFFPPTSSSNSSVISNTSTMKHSTVPISRSTGSAYERPERARTSHACEPCRERKTKCDGERPSCRRCLRTAMSCHYGYGKGWKKRKTAEDLNATSRRLARYELLLNDIMSMVPPNVRTMIEEARQEDPNISPGSDTTETDTPRSQSTLQTELSGSNINMNTRIPLPLPLPTSMSSQSIRTPALRPFESIGSSSMTGAPPIRPPSHGESSEDLLSGPTRLPSITPHGMLIETSLRESQSPVKNHPSESVHHISRERHDYGPSSSPGGRSSSYGEITKQHSAPG